MTDLLPDRERVLGRDHPETLVTRSQHCALDRRYGDSPEALRLFESLLLDQERVQGCDHPDTLTTRHNIASFTGEAGDARKALALFDRPAA